MVTTRSAGTRTIHEILAAARSRHRRSSAAVDHIDTAQYYGSGVVNGPIREALYRHPRRPRMALKIMPHGRP
jgi:hypothetical protein